ncbi:MAG TPA: DUF1592 domain-containing protein [Polyangia bacterium]|nr:DUF1592 domain-containing protein [Polyangia bacterium]
MMIQREKSRSGSVRSRWLTALAVGALAVSCAKSNPGAGGGGGSTGAGGNGVTAAGGTAQPPGSTLPAPAAFKPAPAGLRRLTSVQYRNAIADLLGGGVTVPSDFEPDTSLSGFASIGAALVSLSPHLVEQLETAALSVAHQALADGAPGRAALVGCTPAGTTDDACTTSFLTKFGRRAWRRPLTTDEVSGYASVVKDIQTATKSFYGGLEYGLAGLLESPHFIYREEMGSPEAGNANVLAFDDHELATRLAFFLWNTTPDDALLDAADARQLSQGNGFATQVARLLASPRATAGAREFFTEYYRLAELDSLPQLPSIFPQKTDTLGPAMREETLRFFSNLALTTKGDMRGLFDSPTTFVNAELAKLYGLPAVTGTDFVQTTLPASGLRVGYLGQGSFLALNAHSDIGSPTYRGKFIREMLMCETVPPPPMNVPPLPQDAAGSAPQTMRQKLAVHRAVEPCKTCHTLMDPIGLAYENFDGIGAYRTMDAGQVIDASGDLDGMTFKDPRELATLLHDDSHVMDCFARNLYRYVTGHVESADEEPAITQLVDGFKTGDYQFGALVNGMVNSAGFTLAAPPSQDTGTGGGGGSSATGGATGTGGSAGTTGTGGVTGTGGSTTPPAVYSYATDIAPIIANRCSPCHTTDMKAGAGTNWTYDTLVTNGTVTAALTKGCIFLSAPPRRVVPGDPDHSLLWIKLTSDTHQAMVNNCGDHMPLPSSGKMLTTGELDAVQHWIQQGAKP